MHISEFSIILIIWVHSYSYYFQITQSLFLDTQYRKIHRILIFSLLPYHNTIFINLFPHYVDSNLYSINLSHALAFFRMKMRIYISNRAFKINQKGHIPFDQKYILCNMHIASNIINAQIYLEPTVLKTFLWKPLFKKEEIFCWAHFHHFLSTLKFKLVSCIT